MINGNKVLAVIPARGGSKGIPRKNIRLLAGKPLIAWTIEEAKKSKYIDRLILSSEDKEIISIANQWGCDVPFIRPYELALDNTPGIDPVLHALEKITGYDYVVLLQPTSPLRTVFDIDNIIEKCIEMNSNVCISLSESEKSPYLMYEIDDTDRIDPIIKNSNYQTNRRQDIPKTYVLNGAVYVANINWLSKNKTFISSETSSYIMPRERSVDIDSEMDITIVETIINNYEKERGLKEIQSS